MKAKAKTIILETVDYDQLVRQGLEAHEQPPQWPNKFDLPSGNFIHEVWVRAWAGNFAYTNKTAQVRDGVIRPKYTWAGRDDDGLYADQAIYCLSEPSVWWSEDYSNPVPQFFGNMASLLGNYRGTYMFGRYASIKKHLGKAGKRLVPDGQEGKQLLKLLELRDQIGHSIHAYLPENR